MRIVSGTHKGRIITAPKTLPVRPTTDMAKESLFNILRTRIDFDEVTVLDLFAGIGSISYEFASRGVTEILSIDNNNRCVSFIRETAEKLELDSIQVIKANVFNILPKLNKQFDVIFADPPYDLPGIEKLPQLITENNLLKTQDLQLTTHNSQLNTEEEAVFILEHSQAYSFSEETNFLEERRYGKVHFSFFS